MCIRVCEYFVAYLTMCLRKVMCVHVFCCFCTNSASCSKFEWGGGYILLLCSDIYLALLYVTVVCYGEHQRGVE